MNQAHENVTGNATRPSTETWTTKSGARFRLEPREIAWLSPLDRNNLLAIIALSAIFLVTSFYRVNHTDLWGHLNFGRWIVETHTLPTADPFRDRGLADHFVNSPWLAQVLGYLWYNVAGSDGLVLAHSLLSCLTAGIILLAIRAQGVSQGWATLGAIASYLISLPIVGTIRPQLFGELCFALTLLSVTQLSTRRGPLVWLPLVFCGWANLHGSTPVGLVVVGAYLVGHFLTEWFSSGDFRVAARNSVVRRFALAFLLCLFTTCVNPTGWHVLVDSIQFANNPILASITEWRPLTISSLSGILFFGSVVVTGFLVRFSSRKFEPQTVILLIGLGLASLGAFRMLAWWALAWPVLIAPHAAAVWERMFGTFENNASPKPTTMRTMIAMAIVFLVLVWSPATHGFIVGQNRPEALVIDAKTPLLVAEEIAQRGLKGRFFAPMDWADFIVWKSHGRVQPLVHSHVHLASPGAWTDYERMASGTAQWLEIADFQQLQYLVIRHDGERGLESAALQNPRCRLLYRDQTAALVEIGPATETTPLEKR